MMGVLHNDVCRDLAQAYSTSGTRPGGGGRANLCHLVRLTSREGDRFLTCQTY